MSTDELDALLVRNLRDLDVASKRLRCDIQTRISTAIGDIIATWANEKRWHGDLQWDRDFWLAPREWRTRDGANGGLWLGCFELNEGFRENGLDVYWLTRLCRAGRGMICFRWVYGRDLGATRAQWREYVNDPDQNWRENVQKVGLSYEDQSGLFYLPVRVEAKDLATAIENNAVESALKQPLQDALDELDKAKDMLTDMLNGAKERFAG